MVAALDNENEFHHLLDSLQSEIRRRIAAGEPVGRNEHASGVCLEPGHAKAAAYGRPVTRSLRHGVAPGPSLDTSRLPTNMWIMSDNMPTGNNS